MWMYQIVDADTNDPTLLRWEFESKCRSESGGYAQASNKLDLVEMKQDLLAIGLGGESCTQDSSFVPRPPCSANNLPTVTLFTLLCEMDAQCFINLTESGGPPSLLGQLSELELPNPLRSASQEYESRRPSESTIVFDDFVLAGPPLTVFIQGHELDQLIHHPLEWLWKENPSLSLPPYLSRYYWVKYGAYFPLYLAVYCTRRFGKRPPVDLPMRFADYQPKMHTLPPWVKKTGKDGKNPAGKPPKTHIRLATSQ